MTDKKKGGAKALPKSKLIKAPKDKMIRTEKIKQK
jgi:hypothetical protein